MKLIREIPKDIVAFSIGFDLFGNTILYFRASNKKYIKLITKNVHFVMKVMIVSKYPPFIRPPAYLSL